MYNYIDTTHLINGLTESELTEMRDTINRRLTAIYALRANPLSDVERLLVIKNEYIPAIKAYRDRNQVGLLEAKQAVDAYRFGPR